jgi:hypothetical protein
VKCFQWADFHDQEKGYEECEEDTCLPEVIYTVPLDIHLFSNISENKWEKWNQNGTGV